MGQLTAMENQEQSISNWGYVVFDTEMTAYIGRIESDIIHHHPTLPNGIQCGDGTSNFEEVEKAANKFFIEGPEVPNVKGISYIYPKIQLCGPLQNLPQSLSFHTDKNKNPLEYAVYLHQKQE